MRAKDSLKPSHNDYDWLGDGIYFWEHSPQRAFEFAQEVARRPRNTRQKIRHPAVVGAVIDLQYCLNLLDTRFIAMVRDAYDDLVASCLESGLPLPANTGGPDLLKRHLDCAVIRMLHKTREELHDPPFDSVRAAFIEGSPLYQNAGFSSKNHLQLCVRNPRCIKAYFRPLDENGKPLLFH